MVVFFAMKFYDTREKPLSLGHSTLRVYELIKLPLEIKN
jgi:hypothetical protein